MSAGTELTCLLAPVYRVRDKSCCSHWASMYVWCTCVVTGWLDGTRYGALGEYLVSAIGSSSVPWMDYVVGWSARGKL